MTINRVHKYIQDRYLVQLRHNKSWHDVGLGYMFLGDAYLKASSFSLEENNVRILDTHRIKVVHRFYNGKLLKKS